MMSKAAHRVLDFAFSFMLFLSPYLFVMEDVSRAKNIFFCAGALTFVNAFLGKDFVKLHMKIDLIVGTLLIFAPLIFSYKNLLSPAQYEAHALLGFFFILLVGETRYRSEASIAGPKIILDTGHFIK